MSRRRERWTVSICSKMRDSSAWIYDNDSSLAHTIYLTLLEFSQTHSRPPLCLCTHWRTHYVESHKTNFENWTALSIVCHGNFGRYQIHWYNPSPGTLGPKANPAAAAGRSATIRTRTGWGLHPFSCLHLDFEECIPVNFFPQKLQKRWGSSSMALWCFRCCKLTRRNLRSHHPNTNSTSKTESVPPKIYMIFCL